jgi:adenine-specific DNA-methyltransferase
MGYRFPKTTMDDLLAKEKILFGNDESKIIELKVYAHEYEDKLASVLTLDGRVGSYELREHFPEVTKVFDNPKPFQVISQLMSFTTDKQSVILDFFAGSGTTAEAVMRLNAEDGGTRQFILVQIPQPIDAKKQKEAHTFVTQTLGKPEATIFEITAERIRRAGAKINANKPEVDTGFRVFELVDDPHALILQKPLMGATQEDLRHFQATIATPQPAQLEQILYNLLLAEGLPLTTPIEPLVPQHLYRAGDVLLVLQTVPLTELTDRLKTLKSSPTPVQYLTVYAPWVSDNNFLLGLKTMLETLGMGEDKLRLRG